MSAPRLALERVLARTAEGTRRLEVRDQTFFTEAALGAGTRIGAPVRGRAPRSRRRPRARPRRADPHADRAAPGRGDRPLVRATDAVRPAAPCGGEEPDLRRLAASEGADVGDAMARIRASRSLSQVAEHARAAAVAIQSAEGRDAAEQFWAQRARCCCTGRGAPAKSAHSRWMRPCGEGGRVLRHRPRRGAGDGAGLVRRPPACATARAASAA